MTMTVDLQPSPVSSHQRHKIRLNLELAPEVESPTLADDLGLDMSDSMIAGFLPQVDYGKGLPREYNYRDGDRKLVLSCFDGVALDLVPEEDSRPVKYWMVKNAARENKLSWPEEIWRGNAAEFSIQALPEVVQPDNTVLAIRQYSRGPWIKLQEVAKIEQEVETEAAEIPEPEVKDTEFTLKTDGRPQCKFCGADVSCEHMAGASG